MHAQVYCAAKAGLVTFVRGAAEPLSQKNIRLLGLCPGLISTTLVGSSTDQIAAVQNVSSSARLSMATSDYTDYVQESCRGSCVAMLVEIAAG